MPKEKEIPLYLKKSVPIKTARELSKEVGSLIHWRPDKDVIEKFQYAVILN